MNRSKLSAKELLLISGFAAAVLAGAASAAARPSPGASSLTTVVIRGSDPAAQPPSAKDTPPIVLRGSPPAAAQPPAGQFACPPGSGYDASYGCSPPEYVYAPDDYGYGYWPYWGFDESFSGGRRHGFSSGFAHE